MKNYFLYCICTFVYFVASFFPLRLHLLITYPLMISALSDGHPFFTLYFRVPFW